jgi:hypothetical protein
VNDYRLLMLGAMYENGGNTTHRTLDGHPQLWVYPFESQLGTRLVNDPLTSMFPVKYRWPVFPLEGTPRSDYHAIIDEEGKVRARTPNVSKFRHRPFDLSDDERRDIYCRLVEERGRGRAGNVAAFFEATFEAWKDHNGSGAEQAYVGYSPVLTVDAEAILAELPAGHFLHVVRNPWSAYADTKKRPVPLALADYLRGWVVNQYHALVAARRCPERMHIVRFEDLVADPHAALAPVLEGMGLDDSDALDAPSWNGEPLDEVYPWGTIREPTDAANRATAGELSDEERGEIADRAGPYLAALGYEDF